MAKIMSVNKILIFFCLSGSAFAEQRGSLEVVVRGFLPSKGQIAYLLFNQREGFPRDASKSLGGQYIETPATDTLTVHFQNLPFAEYAVSVYQDLNGNKSLDKNIVGIPREPVGASMNPKAYFGPPPYKRCTFLLSKTQQKIEIHLVK